MFKAMNMADNTQIYWAELFVADTDPDTLRSHNSYHFDIDQYAELCQWIL